jgi:hypothetical protein
MGRRWAERVTGPKAAHWTRPTWPRREKSSKPPWTSGYGPVHAVGLHGGPTGRVTLVAQRPFTQPQPGKGVLPLPKAHAAPGGGAAYPPSSVAAAPWARAGVRFGPTGQALSPARIAHGPKACCPGKAVMRVTRRGAPALGSAGGEAVAMVRVGAAGQLSRAQAPAAKRSRHEGRFTAKRSTPPRWLA